MSLGLENLRKSLPFVGAKRRENAAPPVLVEPCRYPYGPFRFRARLPKGSEYRVLVATDLRTWAASGHGTTKDELLEYIDSEAFKFSYRFYRLEAGGVLSANAIGYASVSLPPGFTMIGNPFDSPQSVSELFHGWPDGTSLNKFDTRFYQLAENHLSAGKWTHPAERLKPGEGALFFNPTSDYKSVSFSGDVLQGTLSTPIPAGFAIRSSLVPQPGHLADDLNFPIADGDVIHLFDRELQKYVLYPYEQDKWTNGAPILSVGESFWVAKTKPGNWTQHGLGS